MSFMNDFLFPDQQAGDKKYMQQKGYGRPTPGGPFAFWLSDAREQDRENSLGGAMGGIHQMMKYIIMMRGGLKHSNGGVPGYSADYPAATKQGVANMSNAPQDPLERALLNLQQSGDYQNSYDPNWLAYRSSR